MACPDRSSAPSSICSSASRKDPGGMIADLDRDSGLPGSVVGWLGMYNPPSLSPPPPYSSTLTALRPAAGHLSRARRRCRCRADHMGDPPRRRGRQTSASICTTYRRRKPRAGHAPAPRGRTAWVRGTTAAVSAPTRPIFAFEAGCWLEAPRHTYVLTVVHRTRDACKPVPYVYCVSACPCPRVYRGHPRGQAWDDEDSRARSTSCGTARSLWRRRMR